MSQAATISVIVPVLNEAEQIAQRLERLQPLRHKGFELLVVDGGSHDGSAELARPLADEVLVTGRGRALQMNAGAGAAKCDWLVFLHLDTELSEAAEAALLAVARDSRINWGWFDVALDNPRWPFRVIAGCMNLRARLTRVCTGDQTLFVRRELFSLLGGFPAVPLMEDVAISKLLRKQAAPCVLGARVTTSSRRWENQGIVATVLLMWRLRLLYFLGVSPERLVQRYYPAANAAQEE